MTNEQGFASIGKARFYYHKKKPSNTYRVIVVGGSTVFGMGAFTPEQNLPAQINEQLQHRSVEVNVEVINAGVPGYTSGLELLYIMSELIYYDPDLIIAYDGWNDMVINNESINEGLCNPLKTVDHLRLERRLNGSYTVIGSARHFLGSVRGALELKLENLASYSLLEDIARKVKGYIFGSYLGSVKFSPCSIEVYRQNLEHMIFVARRHGFKIALFLQPTMGIDDKELTSDEKVSEAKLDDLELRKLFYESARRVFKDLKVRQGNGNTSVCVEDLSYSFKWVTDKVYEDTGHLSLSGNRIIAKRIIHALDACHFLMHKGA